MSNNKPEGHESLVGRCGHVFKFAWYANDVHLDVRRAKAIARDCPSCRQEHAAADLVASSTRKAKKAAAQAKLLKPRLPDGAIFSAIYDAVAIQWSGSLTVDGITFDRKAPSIRKLLFRLDDAYRNALQVATSLTEPTL